MDTRTKPKTGLPGSADVLAAALATMPADPGVDDTEVLAPSTADAPTQQAEPEYGYDDDDVAPPGVDPAKAAAAPATQQASTIGAQGEQPLAAVPAPTQTTQQPASAEPDPWADAVEVEYKDGDTGETYVVRAKKPDADKVKNGYSRRSVMDRTTGFMGKHRAVLEPIIANNRFDDIAPVIDLGMRDQEFAQFVAQAHARRMAGLPLVVQQQQAMQAQNAPPQQAAQQDEEAVFQRLQREYAESLSADGSVDEYTREILIKAQTGTSRLLARQEVQLNNFNRQQQQAAQQQDQQRRKYEYERQVGAASRALLMEVMPDVYNQNTPPEQWQRVMDYANSAGLVQRYGMSPSTFALAAQALRSPLGLAGIGQPVPQAGSVAAQTMADIRRNGEALAAQAAASVGQQTASGGASGSAPEVKPRRERVPRYIVDKRTQQKRALTPTEIANYMKAHPNAV